MSESGNSGSSFCSSCGSPLNAGERFCGNCGAAAGEASGGQETSAAASTTSSSSRSPMLFVGVALVLVAVFAVAGVVLFGDRLGFANNSSQPDPPRLLTDSETSDPEERAEPAPTNPGTEEPESAPEDEPEETPGEAPEIQTPDIPEEETFEQEFITRYYDAVAASDWYTTYSLLDSASQAEFTESEWVEAQEARVAATNPPPLESAIVQDVLGEAAGFVGEVLLSYTDGTAEVVPLRAVLEEDGLKRYLTVDDVDYLRGLVGETETEDTDSGFEAAVEQFVYEYYAAVAAQDWSATYSLLDYGGQAAFTESEWIERQVVRQAASGAPSPVADVSVSAPEFYPPVATVTVTFADGSTVGITVADPHSPDGEYDRVLTPDEIAYLQSL